MTEPVHIQYQIEGARESAAAIEHLGEQVTATGGALGSSTTEVEQFEQALSTATTQTDEHAAAMRQHSQAGIQLVQRMQAAATAIDGLVTAFGGQSDAAKLIGRTLQSTVSFAQLGSTLGPEGALVGGIVGALIPAFQELTLSQDRAAQSAAHLTEVQQHLHEITTAHAAARLQQVEAEVRSGHIRTLTLTEVREQTALVTDTIDRESEGLRNLQAAQARAEAAGQTATQGYHARAEGIWETQQRLQTYIATLGQLGTLEARRMAEQNQATVAGVSAAPSAPVRARPTSHGPSEAEQIDAALAAAQERQQHANEEALAQFQRSVAKVDDAMQRQAADRAQLDQIGATQRDREQADILRKATAQQQLYNRFATAQRQSQSERHQERMRQEQEYESALQSTGATIAGVFTSAFDKAISGQEDFGKALLAGAKQQLIQTGEQFFVEGAGALLTAAGLAFLNPPAAAGKAVEGAGKIALGVGLGAAGIAIPSGAPSSGAAPPPPSSSSQVKSSSGDSKQPNVVVQINSPAVLGGSNDQWARSAARTINQGLLRFGGRP